MGKVYPPIGTKEAWPAATPNNAIEGTVCDGKGDGSIFERIATAVQCFIG